MFKKKIEIGFLNLRELLTMLEFRGKNSGAKIQVTLFYAEK